MYFRAGHLLLLTFLGARGWAKPVQKRFFDLDGDGIPDLCWEICENPIFCLLGDGTWTTIPSNLTFHTATAMVSASTTIQALTTSRTTVESTSSSLSSRTASTTLWERMKSSSSRSSRTKGTPLPTGTLPSPSQFKADKGTKWTIEYVGNLSFTGELQKKGLRGDNCRTGKVGERVIWNCGDMMCREDMSLCGFSMSPAFYGTDDVMVVNTTGLTHIDQANFIRPWSGDKKHSAYRSWGMYSSNVAPLNETHGVVYAWEFLRNGPAKSYLNRGPAVSIVTLGETKPIARRMGSLLAGPDSIGLGLLAILRDGHYIYIYSTGGPSGTTVGRVHASVDAVLDADRYEFLKYGTNDTWIAGIPTNTTTKVGATMPRSSKELGCGVWGSVIYSNYLNKYVMLCDRFVTAVLMHVSDTPWGPWSPQYEIVAGGNLTGSYGPMIHQAYSPGGSDKSWYFSLGPNYDFYMYKVTFNY